HDTSKGSERGSNIIFKAVIDGISVCHLGDLGHIISEETAGRIKPVDVLFMPVGGFFTIGKEESDSIIQALEPDLVIPMHFKTAGVDFPIAPVDDFLEGRQNVTRDGSSEAELTGDGLPAGILVLDPAAVP
ncbi:MAG: MBL fold metallo-hydrolase, partial [bacterium]